MAIVTQLLQKMGLVHGEEPPIQIDEMDASITASDSETSEPPTDSLRTVSTAPRVVKLPKPRFEESLGQDQIVPLEYPFEEVYEKAGVTVPEHGFTVYKLLEMVEAEEMAGLEPQARAQVITGMLTRLPGGGVDIADIAHDAAQRDRALDAFEEFLGCRVADAMVASDSENEELQAEIDRITKSHQERIVANQSRVQEERDRFESWRVSKRLEERKLYDVIAPFVSEEPVTLDSDEA